jgi:hypothetical protein
MNITNEYLDMKVLDEGFTLSALWQFRENLALAKSQVEDIKMDALRDGEIVKATRYGRELHFIVRNLETVEAVMVEKENDIFFFTEYGDACLN